MKRDTEYSIELIDPANWDELVARMPQHTVFHTSAWLSSVEKAYGLTLLLAAASKDDRCVGVWPCTITRKGPLRITGSPLPGTSTAYMGPLFAEDADPIATMNAFLNDRNFGRSAYIACRALDHGDRELDLQAVGFQKTLRFETYLVDLSLSEDELWSNLKSECRNRIRKARKSGLETRIETSDEFLDDFWRMSEEVFEKSGKQPTFTRGFLRKVWKSLDASDSVMVLSAFHEEKRVGTLFLPHDSHTVYYWAGGSDSGFNKMAPNNLMHWDAIAESKRRGFKYYDFISSKGGPGRFKKTFGPEPREICSHWERARSPAIMWLKNRYEQMARHKRRLASA